jgi:hypothetical protein
MDPNDGATLPSAYAETARRHGGEAVVARYRELVHGVMDANPCGLAPERHITRLTRMLGGVAEAVEEALGNDARIDADERAAIRRAMTKLRKQLEALDRDLEACG